MIICSFFPFPSCIIHELTLLPNITLKASMTKWPKGMYADNKHIISLCMHISTPSDISASVHVRNSHLESDDWERPRMFK